jgi:putative flippase GtrA
MLIYRFLDHDAFLFGFVAPVVALLLYVIALLVRSAVVARFTISMQVTRRAREKMRRKRHLQLFLFFKVTILIGTVAGLGVFAKLTGMTSTMSLASSWHIQLNSCCHYGIGPMHSKPSVKYKIYLLFKLPLF